MNAALVQPMQTLLPAPSSTLTPQQLADIKKTAKEFEGMFLTEMFNHMYSGLDVDPMFGGGSGEKIYRSLMTAEYGKMVAKSPQGIGIADAVQKQMIMLQENAQRR